MFSSFGTMALKRNCKYKSDCDVVVGVSGTRVSLSISAADNSRADRVATVRAPNGGEW